MIRNALFVRLEAKPGKEQAVADFLAVGLVMAAKEATTPIWFALKLSPTTFGIFDAFAGDEDRRIQSHHRGPAGATSQGETAQGHALGHGLTHGPGRVGT